MAGSDEQLAHELAAMPGVWRRLLAIHVADRLGRCLGCWTASGSGQRWPCTLHEVAAEAQRVHGRRLGQASSDPS